MTDLAMRSAERADPAAALGWRIRTGGVSQERLTYAAALGHEVALGFVDPLELPLNAQDESELSIERGAVLLSRVEAVRWACDLSVLARLPMSDAPPAAAIAAARAWADCLCREHADAAREAGGAVSDPKSLKAELRWVRSYARLVARLTAPDPACSTKWLVARAVYWAKAAGSVTWREIYSSLADRLLA